MDVWETTQENSIDTKRKQVNNVSMQETVKDTQYGFLGSESETGDLELDNGSKKELHKNVAVLQTGCINNQTIQMMITIMNPTLSLTLGPCLSPFQMKN